VANRQAHILYLLLLLLLPKRFNVKEREEGSRRKITKYIKMAEYNKKKQEQIY